MIPRQNLPYFKGSIGTFCIITSIAVSGWVRLIFPSTVSHTSALAYLPGWTQVFVNIAWALAGSVAALGIASGRRDVERGGLAFLGCTFTAYLVAVAYYKLDTLPSVLYIPGIAAASFLRLYYFTEARQVVVYEDRDR